MFSTGMPIINAIGSSLVGVTAFGATAALNYAAPGFIDWRLAVTFIIGGVVGAWPADASPQRSATGEGL